MEVHGHEEEPHNAGLHSVPEGEDHHHGEKKSVLKKVKDKAKKIKDTIKKHGHGHEHDDDDDDGGELGNDHHIHGAPNYESTVIRSVDLPRETNTNLEKPTDKHNARDEGMSRAFGPGQTTPHLGKEKPNVGEQRIKNEAPLGLEQDAHFPKNRPLEIPHSNYQSKFVDSIGPDSKEAQVAPLVHRFDNFNVSDESASKQRSYTGSHDQFAPQPTPTQAQTQFNPESNPESQHLSKSQDTSIAEKISSTASVVADMALSAKNVVASKLGYGGGTGSPEGHDSSKKSDHKAPVYEKVQGSGASEHQGGDMVSTQGANRGASMREYLADKFRPGDEDKALADTITDTFSKKKEAENEKPVGRVTESKEVAARLGTAVESKREGKDALAAGTESSGDGVVDRLRDAVGSWLGKSTGMQTAQDSLAKSYVNGGGGGSD